MGENGKKTVMAAKLVLMKTVSTHGAFELRLHIPEEAALEAIQKFGWPTMASPVSVAIARLEEEPAQAEPSEEPKHRLARLIADRIKQPEATQEEPPPGPQPEPAPDSHWTGMRWPDLSPAQQTGIIRNEPEFREFVGVNDVNRARDYIRWYCGVSSCADILPGTEAAARWAQLQVRYGNWLSQKRTLRKA